MERRINGPDDELLSPAEAAKWLNVPHTTFKAWVRDGRIPAPHGPNQSVQYYSWDQVLAMRILLAMGFLPLPEQPKEEKPPPRGGG